MEYGPSAVAVVVLTVKIEVLFVLPEGVTVTGVRLQVTSLAPEEQLSTTALLNPSTEAILTVELVDPPGAMVAGDAEVIEI